MSVKDIEVRRWEYLFFSEFSDSVVSHRVGLKCSLDVLMWGLRELPARNSSLFMVAAEGLMGPYCTDPKRTYCNRTTRCLC